MASGRFETKCIGPLETVSLACNSSTVATVTLTATALSTDQNACLSISMSDVPTCIEFTACLGNIGTGQLGTLGCTLGPVRSAAGAYGGYTNMSFDKTICCTSCSGGPYLRHYNASNTAISSTDGGRAGFHNIKNAFNIPPAIESYCFCERAATCCCSNQKGLLSIAIPYEYSCQQAEIVIAKMCCFNRFGGGLTDDCYYQLISAGVCCTCSSLSCAAGQAGLTPFGMWNRLPVGAQNTDVAIDWWSNGKMVWSVPNDTQVCAPIARMLDNIVTAGCSPWTAGHNMDSVCPQNAGRFCCCLNGYPTGGLCTFPFGGTTKACAIKCTWGIPCAALESFYPMVMTGCNLQVYQHAYAGIGAQFKTNMCQAEINPICSSVWWCQYGILPSASQYDSNCCIGLRITPGGSFTTDLGADKPHNFVRWMTYNKLDRSNYFLWYHECTPVMNGIYSVSEKQLYCIYQHQINCNKETCNAGSEQTTDSVINTKFATKQSCVPAIWCAYKKAWCMLNTNAFPSDSNEFSMFASPTDWGTSALCFCRFVSTNLIDWSLADPSGCTYKQELPLSTSLTMCYIDFNPSTCNFETNCSNFASLPTGNTAVLEFATSVGKLERSGIVMGATDRFYVKNTSNTISASVTVWGFNE